MGYREVFVVEVQEVLRQWGLGRGLRGISRSTGLDRKTVRRYVAAAVEAGLTREQAAAATDEMVGLVVEAVRVGSPGERGASWRLFEEHRGAIEKWLEQGLTLTKVHELLKRTTGQPVVYRTLHRFAREELGHGKRRTTVRVADGKPGEAVEVDFGLVGRLVEEEGGEARKVYALVLTAAYSRHQYVYLTHRQTLEELVEGLERGWSFFGGVFRVVVLDNARTVVAQADPCGARLSGRFVAYAQERGFVVDATRVRRPQDKAKVERTVQYVQRSFWQGESFRSLQEGQEAAEKWCRDVAGRRIHGTTRKRPVEVFEAEEKALLLPAPESRYDLPSFLHVTVQRDHHVTADRALYSVPTAYIGEEVTVRLDRELVRIYHRGKLIKTHPRQPPGGRSTDEGDYPPEVAAYAMRDTDTLAEKARRAGAHVGRYAERLIEGPLPWTRMRQVYRLLGLVERYGCSRVDQACARSLDLDVVDVMRIDRMLARALEAQPTPGPTRPWRTGTVLRFARPESDFAPVRKWKEMPDDDPL
jgi:transposase